MNRLFRTDLGYSEGAVEGKIRLNDILTVGSRVFFQTHFYPLIRMQERFNEIFLSFRTAGDKEIPVLLNVVLTGDNHYHEIHCAGIRISQRNRYEREILEAIKVAESALLENESLNRMREQLEMHQENLEKKLQKLAQKNSELKQFSTIISHDLQEPIRKIGTFVNLIERGDALKDQPAAIEHLSKIRDASDKMRYLVLSLQKYLSLTEKRFLPGPVDTKEIFEKAVQKAIVESGIPIEAEVDGMPEIFADRHMISGLFNEMISNSTKFRDRDKERLKISLRAERLEKNIYVELEHKYKYEEYVRLIYSDNGIGFDNSYSGDIFTLFRKAHADSSGQGFGLAYCKKVVALHHGTITATGTPGVGAEFTITLPVLSKAHNELSV